MERRSPPPIKALLPLPTRKTVGGKGEEKKEGEEELFGRFLQFRRWKPLLSLFLLCPFSFRDIASISKKKKDGRLVSCHALKLLSHTEKTAFFPE